MPCRGLFLLVTVLSPFTLHSLPLCIEVGDENFYESQHENTRIISKEYVQKRKKYKALLDMFHSRS